MAAPLSAASAALAAQSVLEEQKHMISAIVVEHVRNKTPITGRAHFWQEVAKTLQERRGISRSDGSIRKEYNAYRAWAIQNFGRDGDERKFIKDSLRALRRDRDAGVGVGGSVGEEVDGDEEENEGEGGDVPSAFDNMSEGLALPSAGPAQQQQQQQPPSGGNLTFTLPVRPKED